MMSVLRNDGNGQAVIRIRRRNQKTDDLEMTPLIDVVFLLLLFFMLTSTFISQQAMELNLPSASTASDLASQDALRISLNASGELSVDGRVVEAKTLTPVIDQALAADEQIPVILQADASCSIQAMVAAMDAIRRSKAKQVQLLTVDEP